MSVRSLAACLAVVAAVMTPGGSGSKAQGAAGVVSVFGTVLGGLGQPLTGAVVRVVDSAGNEVLTTRTDMRGSFVVPQVPHGRYLIQAEHSGFLPSSFGAPGSTTLGTPLVVSDDAFVGPLVITMPPAAMISVTVYDRTGRGVNSAELALFREADTSQLAGDQPRGRRFLDMGVRRRTDDRGMFTFRNLVSGTYVLCVVQRDAWRSVRSRSYYPGVSNPEDAHEIRVKAGETVSLTMVPTDTLGTRFHGAVRDRQGNGVPDARLELVSANGLVPSYTAVTDADGQFAFGDIVPQAYSLIARKDSASTVVTTGPAFLWGETTVHVDAMAAPEPLTIYGAPTMTIRTLATGDRAVGFPQLTLQPLGRSTLRQKLDVQLARSTVNVGSVAPAKYLISINSPRRQEGQWQIDSVRVNGRDVSDHIVDLRAEDVTLVLEVRITFVAERVEGSIENARGMAAAQFAVVLLSDDGGMPSRDSVRFTRPATDGSFGFDAVKPGPYRIAVVDRELLLNPPTNMGGFEDFKQASLPVMVPTGGVAWQGLRIRQ